MRLFVDTNSFLAYFAEDADTRSLGELERLLKAEKLRLFYTVQLGNEYARNVATPIDRIRQAIKDSTLQLTYKPVENKKLKAEVEAKVSEINKAFETARDKRAAEYEERAEKTERLVETIFTLGQRVDYSDAIIEKAKLRHIKGNPPKKKNDTSYGDAINWESVLEYATDDDLVLITRDPDYLEKGAKGEILNRVLKQEWQSKTKKTIRRYPTLGEFINTFEQKLIIPAATIKKEGIFATPFDYNGRAVVNAISALRLADSAYISSVASVAATMPDFTTLAFPPQGVLKVYAEDIARVSGFFGTGNVFPPGFVPPVSGIFSARMTDVEPQTIDMRTSETKKKSDAQSPLEKKSSDKK